MSDGISAVGMSGPAPTSTNSAQQAGGSDYWFNFNEELERAKTGNVVPVNNSTVSVWNNLHKVNYCAEGVD